jgi:DNA-binding response OmpR family regulator
MTACNRQSVRVLIVDDQASVRLPIADDLAEAGFTVEGAETVAEALAAAARTPPDVVLLDLFLKNESGLEVARKLREGRGSPPLIIALSGHTAPEYVRGAGEAGCDFYLAKMCPREQLVAAIDDLVGIRQQVA